MSFFEASYLIQNKKNDEPLTHSPSSHSLDPVQSQRYKSFSFLSLTHTAFSLHLAVPSSHGFVSTKKDKDK